MEGVDLNIQSEGAFINKGWDIMLFLTEWYVAWKVMFIWRVNLSFLLQGAGLRTLASHQCVLGSIGRHSVIHGLSLLLALYTSQRGFSLGTRVFPSPQKLRFPNAQGFLNKFLWPPWFPLGKQITFFLHSLCECKFKVVLALNIWYAKKKSLYIV